MTERIERLTARLQEQGERTVRFFREIPATEWDRGVYSEGANWKIREVLMHFLGSEKGVARLVELVVGGEPGVPVDFDLDRYNERKVDQLSGIAPEELLRQFAEARDRTIEMVRGFTDSDLDKVGRHPFLGRATVEDMIQLMYRHNQIHQRDLRRILP